MALAMDQANRASAAGDVPVGCVITGPNDEVLATGFNEREASGDPTAHAEILALRRAAEAIGHWRLIGTTVYVTLEPCPMCAGALVNARVARVVWGADDPKAGAMQSLYEIGVDGRLNHRVEWTRGVLAEPCAELLRAFFARLRQGAARTGS